MAYDFSYFQKWRNFGKSGHTGRFPKYFKISVKVVFKGTHLSMQNLILNSIFKTQILLKNGA